ncbi:MAG TPA: hypothetical protein VE133_13425, partial [Candidatus Sulfotelmatobacter sp.]|nr:hypothetical protein [Candidatus Sulfotelmatobacter sp.]
MGKAIHLERDRVQPSSASGVRQSLHETAVGMPVQHLAQLAMSVNNSPRIQQNLRLREQITANVRTSPLVHTSKSPAPEVAQMVLDARNVEAKAAQFLVAHARESELIGEANTLLEKYSTNATRENLKKLNDDLPGIRDKITEQTNLQADIIGEYAASDVEAVHKTFLDKVLEKDAAEMRPLFDKLLNQTTLKEGVDEKFKHRFLSYVLQSSKYATGEGRFRELMGLLGDREFVLGTRGLGAPLAGLESADDDPKSEKANARDKVADKELLKNKKGNLAEFVKAKRAEEDQRQENADKDEVGNIQIDMDSSQQVLPVYFGLTGKQEVQAYTSPMFTAVHHELGHAVNRLKGKHGRKADQYKSDEGALAHLTDEEELQ